MGDSTLQRVYQALCTEPYWLPYLATFQFMETRMSDIMQFNHVVTAVLDLLNSNCYVSKVVIIHTGHSDFGVMPQHLVKFYTAQMANVVTELLHSHLDTTTLAPLPHSCSQNSIMWAGVLKKLHIEPEHTTMAARAATLAGITSSTTQSSAPRITLHSWNQAKWFYPGWETSSSWWMCKWQLICKVDPEYHPPLLSQITTHMRNDTKFQEVRQPSHSVTVVNNK